ELWERVLYGSGGLEEELKFFHRRKSRRISNRTDTITTIAKRRTISGALSPNIPPPSFSWHVQKTPSSPVKRPVSNVKRQILTRPAPAPSRSAPTHPATFRVPPPGMRRLWIPR